MHKDDSVLNESVALESIADKVEVVEQVGQVLEDQEEQEE